VELFLHTLVSAAWRTPVSLITSASRSLGAVVTGSSDNSRTRRSSSTW
jgi:hypothetical protein